MFGLNWAELMIISVVALVVIGPEDLPKMFRELGRFTAKLRQMSREFSRAMEQAAKETGVSDVAKDLKTATSPSALGLDAVKSSMDKFEKWDPLKNAAKPSTAKPLTPPPLPPVAHAGSSLTSVAERDAQGAGETSVEDELADDLAEIGAEIAAEAPPAHGPNTQALYDKAAMRARVMAEQTAKLKAIEAGTYAEPAPQDPAVPGLTRDLDAPKAKPKAAPKAEAAPVEKPKRGRAKPAPEAVAEAKTEAKPKAPRKKKPSEDVA